MIITTSHVIEHLYCPRFTYYQYVASMPQYEEKNNKVLIGRSTHQHRAMRNINYLRKKIGVVKKEITPYLAAGTLRGIPDEVLTLKDGTMAPLEYKFAEYNNVVYKTYKQQLYIYAYLINKNYNKPVNHAYLIYTRSNNILVKIEIPHNYTQIIEHTLSEIHKIIEKKYYPGTTRNAEKCINCTFRNICPK